MDTTDIIKRLDRIEKSLTAIESKRTWVKVSVIQELTGWGGDRMRWARENGLVKQRKGSNGIEYLLESLNKQFIK